MTSMQTAVLHLRGDVDHHARRELHRSLLQMRGVWAVSFPPSAGVLTASYDDARLSLADVVRVVEDSGTIVSGVAVRATPPRRRWPHANRRIALRRAR